jgi:hypothetical protein
MAEFRPGRLSSIVTDRLLESVGKCEFLCFSTNNTYEWMTRAQLNESRKGSSLLSAYEVKQFAAVTRVLRKRKRRGQLEYKLRYNGFGRGHERWVKAECVPLLDEDEIPMEVTKRMFESFDVQQVLGWQEYGCFGDKMYLVRWGDYPESPDSWVPAKHMNFTPDKCLPRIGESRALGVVSPSKRKDSDWIVFQKYFLPDIQREMRYGWRTTRSRTGRVRSGIGSFCPPAAYEMLFCNKGIIREAGAIKHHTFASPQDVPLLLTPKQCGDGSQAHAVWGSVLQSWWRSETDTPGVQLTDPVTGEKCTQRQLFEIRSPVVVHYHSEKHRMTFSFTFAFATRSEFQPVWNTMIGPAKRRQL